MGKESRNVPQRINEMEDILDQAMQKMDALEENPAGESAEYAEVIGMFHRMWDGFPGLARLIDRNHHVIAANPVALEKGFAPGCVCAKVGAPEIHRQCKLTKLFQTGEAQTDNVIEDRIRGWMPVEGYPDLSVHFAVMIPEE